MNAYEVMLEVDGLAVVRTERAHSAMDAFQMALINANADTGTTAKSIRVTHIGPPLADVLRAQATLVKQIEAITRRRIAHAAHGGKAREKRRQGRPHGDPAR